MTKILEFRKAKCLSIMIKHRVVGNLQFEVNNAKKQLDIDKAINKILPESIRDKVKHDFDQIFNGSVGPLIVRKR